MGPSYALKLSRNKDAGVLSVVKCGLAHPCKSPSVILISSAFTPNNFARRSFPYKRTVLMFHHPLLIYKLRVDLLSEDERGYTSRPCSTILFCSRGHFDVHEGSDCLSSEKIQFQSVNPLTFSTDGKFLSNGVFTPVHSWGCLLIGKRYTLVSDFLCYRPRHRNTALTFAC